MNNTYFYHPDHLGSTSLVTNSYGEITQNISYIPYGEVFVEETAGGWQSPYYFNAKELDEETGLYYYGARYLDPAGARWLSADPMLEKYVGMSPYNYCAGNPVKLSDPMGMNPVYDEYGNMLGTDDKGLQGDPIVMWKDNFEQGMSSEDAAIYDMGLSLLTDQIGSADEYGSKSYDRYQESFASLSSRPDWNGKITLDEANDWYRGGNGQPLYVDVSMIDLSPVSTSDLTLNKTTFINFASLKYRNIETGLVYGTIGLKLVDMSGNVIVGNPQIMKLDRYDFEMHKGRFLRNCATKIGEMVAGEGRPYDILMYNYNGKVEVK